MPSSRLYLCCFALLCSVHSLWGVEAELKQKISSQLILPVVPEGSGTPVDRLLSAYWQAKKVNVLPLADETVFLRRVYLDLLGRLPTVAERTSFLQETASTKRETLVAQLLNDNEGYAAHWISFWQDLLRDGKQDLGSTDIFRPITPWLKKSLTTNKPLNVMVQELINPAALEKIQSGKAPDQDDGKSFESVAITEDDASGFVLGLRAGLEKPRGDQAWEVQAAQNIAQVFLGVPLKCATCHDSFVDKWTMHEAWSLAAVFAEKPLEMVRCELPTGEMAHPEFFLPEVGQIDAQAPVLKRREQLAELVTSPKNGLFARTVVNRVWAKIMGKGLVPTLEDMQQPCWNQDLLDWLAADFIIHKFDLKHLIQTITTSQAYAAIAVEPEPQAKESDFVFTGPIIKRLTAEQFLDGVHQLAGRKKRVWTDNGSKLMEVLGRPDHRTVSLCRNEKCSTMQSLELLNGESIHALIYGMKQEIPKLTNSNGVKTYTPPKLDPTPQALLEKLAKEKSSELIDRLFITALTREPTANERNILLASVGEEPSPETVGDILWLLVNLPEFQVVR
jgi:Protein of unknown function (DUF1549)/Protein of unknown function (DUF1553)